MEWIIDPDNNPMTDDGAQVVNMSLGATGTYTQMVAPTDNMVAAGVFPSFSIGNTGPGASTTGSPGNVPSAFGVGATDSRRRDRVVLEPRSGDVELPALRRHVHEAGHLRAGRGHLLVDPRRELGRRTGAARRWRLPTCRAPSR